MTYYRRATVIPALLAVLTLASGAGCGWLWKHVVCPLDNGCQSARAR